MKVFVFAVLLLLGVAAALAAEPREALNTAEQVYVASPYAYGGYHYGAYPAVGYGAYYYGR